MESCYHEDFLGVAVGVTCRAPSSRLVCISFSVFGYAVQSQRQVEHKNRQTRDIHTVQMSGMGMTEFNYPIPALGGYISGH